MGIIFTRFRKQPTTLEKLKKIEDGLRRIEDYKRTTEQKQKRTVANLVIYGVALYMLACVIVFVWFLPESWLVRLALLVPLVLVPLIIYWMKRLISKYFDTRMLKANEEYVDLQRKKKDLIDSIMETETFNKAKEILSRYAPEKLEKKETHVSSHPGTVAIKPGGELRNRITINAKTSTLTSTPKADWIAPVGMRPQYAEPRPNVEQIMAQKVTSLVPQLRLPQPLFPKDRSLGEKLVEYIVGDGPGYRYALICKFCREHNGMALQEEFPYMSYTCCYCRKFNPARVARPTAPRLPEPENLRKIRSAHAGSTISLLPTSRGVQASKLIPFDKHADRSVPRVQDTEDTEPTTTQIDRISIADASKSSNEDIDNLSEPEDICRNNLENDGIDQLSEPEDICRNPLEKDDYSNESASEDEPPSKVDEPRTENGEPFEMLRRTKMENDEYGQDICINDNTNN